METEGNTVQEFFATLIARWSYTKQSKGELECPSGKREARGDLLEC